MSIATVSRVRNAPEKVSDATRRKVMAVINEPGIVPKAEARARALQPHRPDRCGDALLHIAILRGRLRGVASALANSPYELVVYTVDSMERAVLVAFGNGDALDL
ncbi:MAG: hypothetical protein Kow00120_25380 [Anaerolineae bacterium]